jgi:hypothetical protein
MIRWLALSLSLTTIAHAHAQPRLAAAREDHTATRLLDGSVLVVGGLATELDASPPVERYQPASRRFTTAGTLAHHRKDHTATVLDDGRVLVAGGHGFQAGLWVGTPPELFDPQTSTWSKAAPLSRVYVMPAAVKLTDGRVLLAGGQGGISSVQTSTFTLQHSNPEPAVYDPVKNTWSDAGALVDERERHAMVALPGGKAVVLGGASNEWHLVGTTQVRSIHSLDTIELWEPTTRTWRAVGRLSRARFNATATVLPDGRVFVASDDETADVCEMATFTCIETPPMKQRRYSFAVVALATGEVAVIGGAIPSGAERPSARIARSEIFDPKTSKWRNGPSLPRGRRNLTATLLPDGRVLVAGGDVICCGGGTVQVRDADVLRF